MGWITIPDVAIWIASNIERGNIPYKDLPKWVSDKADFGRLTCPTLSIEITNDIYRTEADYGCKITGGNAENGAIPLLKKLGGCPRTQPPTAPV